MTESTFDILVAGEINPDLILSGDVNPSFGQAEKLIDSADLTIGSSSVIFACGAARLGLKVGFFGLCGDDLFGKFMLNEMTIRGVDISNILMVSGQKTGISIILSKGTDRAILTYPGLIPNLSANLVTDDLLKKFRHLHIASYFLQTSLQPGLPDLFSRAYSLGLTTSLDPNWDPSQKWKGFQNLLNQVDVFLPNENEVKSITGEDNLDLACQQLSRSEKIIAIKLGEDGAIATKEGKLARLPSLPMEVVDTVGAGDSFDAGFLYGFLKGWDLEISLKLAITCGSLSTRASGGTSAQPTLDQAMDYVTSIN